MAMILDVHAAELMPESCSYCKTRRQGPWSSAVKSNKHDGLHCRRSQEAATSERAHISHALKEDVFVKVRVAVVAFKFAYALL